MSNKVIYQLQSTNNLTKEQYKNTSYNLLFLYTTQMMIFFINFAVKNKRRIRLKTKKLF